MTEAEINQLKTQLPQAQQEITKWKYKFNAKNADYVLLFSEHEKLKKSPFNSPWFYLLLALLALAFWYFFSP